MAAPGSIPKPATFAYKESMKFLAAAQQTVVTAMRKHGQEHPTFHNANLQQSGKRYYTCLVTSTHVHFMKRHKAYLRWRLQALGIKIHKQATGFVIDTIHGQILGATNFPDAARYNIGRPLCISANIVFVFRKFVIDDNII
jgi:hypothetical protein